MSGDTFSKRLRYFAERFPGARALRLVKDLRREKTLAPNIELRRAEPWLRKMPL